MKKHLPVWICLSVVPISVILLVVYVSTAARSVTLPEMTVVALTAAPGLVAALLLWGASHLSPPRGSTYLLVVAMGFCLLVAVEIGHAFWLEFLAPFDQARGEPNIVWLLLPFETSPIVLLALAPWALLVVRRARSLRPESRTN